MTKEIIITTWQSSKGTNIDFEKEFGIDFLHSVGCIVFDEVHGAQAKVSKKIVRECINTDLKMGLTGTLFDTLEEGDVFKNRLIEGLFGPIIYAITASQLIDLGYAAPLHIHNLMVEYGQHDKMTYQEEMKFVSDDLVRLNWLVKTFSRIPGNHLVLFRTRVYGKSLANLFASQGTKQVLYIDGDVDPKERDRFRAVMNSNSEVVMVASYGTTSTGVSINRIHHVVFAQPMKAKIKVIQAIGRGLRLHETKDEINIWDIVDWVKYGDFNGYLYKHFEIRARYYDIENYPFEIRYIDINKIT